MDLTKITTPFGMLDEKTQDALCAWPHGLQIFWKRRWVNFDNVARLQNHRTYRARPAPAKHRELWHIICEGEVYDTFTDADKAKELAASHPDFTLIHYREVTEGGDA